MKFINGAIYISKFKIFIYDANRDGFDCVAFGKIIKDRSFNKGPLFSNRKNLKDPNKISEEVKKLVIRFLFDNKIDEKSYYQAYENAKK